MITALPTRPTCQDSMASPPRAGVRGGHALAPLRERRDQEQHRGGDVPVQSPGASGASPRGASGIGSRRLRAARCSSRRRPAPRRRTATSQGPTASGLGQQPEREPDGAGDSPTARAPRRCRGRPAVSSGREQATATAPAQASWSRAEPAKKRPNSVASRKCAGTDRRVYAGGGGRADDRERRAGPAARSSAPAHGTLATWVGSWAVASGPWPDLGRGQASGSAARAPGPRARPAARCGSARNRGSQECDQTRRHRRRRWRSGRRAPRRSRPRCAPITELLSADS